MAIKHYENKKRISLSSKKKIYYKSDIKDNTSPNKPDDKYLF